MLLPSFATTFDPESLRLSISKFVKKNNLFYEIRIWLNTIFSDKNQIKSINKISIKRCKVINDIFKKDCLIKVYKPTERGL